MEKENLVTVLDRISCFDICELKNQIAIGQENIIRIFALDDSSSNRQSKVEEGCIKLKFSKDGNLIALLNK